MMQRNFTTEHQTAHINRSPVGLFFIPYSNKSQAYITLLNSVINPLKQSIETEEFIVKNLNQAQAKNTAIGTTAEYNEQGLQTSLVEDLVDGLQWWRKEYDDLGRETLMVESSGSWVKTSYDRTGKATREVCLWGNPIYINVKLVA